MAVAQLTALPTSYSPENVSRYSLAAWTLTDVVTLYEISHCRDDQRLTDASFKTSDSISDGDLAPLRRLTTFTPATWTQGMDAFVRYTRDIQRDQVVERMMPFDIFMNGRPCILPIQSVLGYSKAANEAVVSMRLKEAAQGYQYVAMSDPRTGESRLLSLPVALLSVFQDMIEHENMTRRREYYETVSGICGTMFPSSLREHEARFQQTAAMQYLHIVPEVVNGRISFSSKGISYGLPLFWAGIPMGEEVECGYYHSFMGGTERTSIAGQVHAILHQTGIYTSVVEAVSRKDQQQHSLL